MTPPSFLAVPSSAAGAGGSSARKEEGIDAAEAVSATTAARASKGPRRLIPRQGNLDEKCMGFEPGYAGTLPSQRMVTRRKAALQGGNPAGIVWCHAGTPDPCRNFALQGPGEPSGRLSGILRLPVNFRLPCAILPPMGFSPSFALRFGWETFKKRPWLFVGAFVLVALAQAVVEGLSRAVDAPFGGAESDHAFLGGLVSLALSTLISMGITAFGLAAHGNPETVELSALWRPHPFWKYLGLTILFALIFVALSLLGIALVAALFVGAGLRLGIPV